MVRESYVEKRLCRMRRWMALRGLAPNSVSTARFSASLRFSRSHTSSIRHSVVAGLSMLRSTASDSVPRSTAIGASPLPSAAKASSSWSFCRLSLTSRDLYSPLLTVWAFVRDVPGPASPAVSPLSGECPNRVDRLLTPTMPVADFCAAVRSDWNTPDTFTINYLIKSAGFYRSRSIEEAESGAPSPSSPRSASSKSPWASP
jgi:hypothetical protein